MSNSKDWGLLPNEVLTLIRKREWQNETNLKKRLTGERPFPVRIGLKPPQGNVALTDLTHFQHFVSAWKNFSAQNQHQNLVEWEDRTYRKLSTQRIPTFLNLNSLDVFIEYLGPEAVSRYTQFQQKMAPLLDHDQSLYPVLIKHISILEALSTNDTHMMAMLLPQLQANMGSGNYQRALPLTGVDTKFLETHQTLIAALLDVIHVGAITSAGGLNRWLNCLDVPNGWLTIRPLCKTLQRSLSDLPIFQLPFSVIRNTPLPGSRILVVENLQSGLGLPELSDTLAIFGAGNNTQWLTAPWLKERKIGYWGDIDTWGLKILSDARQHQPSLIPLMMDDTTVLAFENKMVPEPNPVLDLPERLTDTEQALFKALQSGHYHSSRLEQERLTPDYIEKCLMEWLRER